jgi:hypothetical protein
LTVVLPINIDQQVQMAKETLMRLIPAPLASLAVVGMALQGAAATAAPTVREVCMPEIRQMCAAELAARSRVRIKSCLQTNKDKLSEGCRSAIAEKLAARKE